jgi:ornithine cyclodeaminase/alanine dehydrogenase-like protein (mu-crystallin family)
LPRVKLRVLAESDVRRCLDMREAVDAQAQAFALLAAKKTVEGLRTFVTSASPPGLTIFNPSYLRNGAGFGIKVVSDFLDNDDRTIPRMSALLVLFCGRTGLPRTVMEAGHLTDMRTGAGTALAARYLARADSASLVLFGAGRVARNQLLALAAVLPLKRVRIVARSPSRADAFVRWARNVNAGMPHDIAIVSDADAAVAEADVVVCATTSTQPVLYGAALRPGTFVAAVGANQVEAREVDSVTIVRASKRVIDSREDCLRHAGDLQIPIREGVLSEADVAEIAEVISAQRPGRDHSDEITYYKSIGVPIQDVFTAQRIEARAIEAQIGTVLEIGGDPLQL